MMGPIPWTFLPDALERYATAGDETHYRIARKIAGNERLTDADRAELRRNLDAVIAEMREIFMRERRWE